MRKGSIEILLHWMSDTGSVHKNWIGSERIVDEIMCCIRQGWPWSIEKVRQYDNSQDRYWK